MYLLIVKDSRFGNAASPSSLHTINLMMCVLMPESIYCNLPCWEVFGISLMLSDFTKGSSQYRSCGKDSARTMLSSIAVRSCRSSMKGQVYIAKCQEVLGNYLCFCALTFDGMYTSRLSNHFLLRRAISSPSHPISPARRNSSQFTEDTDAGSPHHRTL